MEENVWKLDIDSRRYKLINDDDDDDKPNNICLLYTSLYTVYFNIIDINYFKESN